MTKQQIYDAMGGRISMVSIGEYSGEYVIIGKFGIVSFMDEYWDIWVTGVHKGVELGTGKVNNLCSTIFDTVGTQMVKLTREATGIAQDSEAAFLAAIILGARRKKKVSAKSLANLRKFRK